MDGCECGLINSRDSGWSGAKGKHCILLEIRECDGEGVTAMGFDSDGWQLVFMLLVKTESLKKKRKKERS